MAPSPTPLPTETPSRFWGNRWSWGIFLLLLIIALSNGFALWYVLHEHIVYHFDSIGYWTQLAGLKKNLAADPWNAIYWAWRGFRIDDYPSFTVVPLLPFIALFGVTRLAYILAIVNTFAVPSIVAFVLLADIFIGLAHPLPASNESDAPRLGRSLLALVTILLSPIFWITSIAGMPSVGGLAIVCVVLFLTLRSFPNLRWRDEVTVGVLLFFLARFRRWFLIWIAAYYAARLILILFLALRKRDWRSALRSIAQFSCSIGIFSTLLFAVTTPFAWRALSTDYSVLYAPYQIPNFGWLRAIAVAHGQFGYISLLIALAGLLFALFQPRLRLIAAFFMIHYIIALYLQIMNQGFAYQHLYLLLPTILLFSVYFFFRIAQVSRWFRTTAAVATVVFGFLFLAVFYPPVMAKTSKFVPWTSKEKWAPAVQTDLDSLRSLHRTLSDLTYGTDDSIYVLSLTGILNYEMLRNQHFTFPDGPDLSDRVFITASFDLSDGFPSNFFKAKYVVIPEPPQYFSSKQYSLTVAFPLERIVNNEGIGKAYRRLPYRFPLRNNVTVSIFERTRKFTRAEIREFSGALRSAYPTMPFIYTGSIVPGVLSGS